MTESGDGEIADEKVADNSTVKLQAIKDPNLGTIVDNRYQLLENVGSGGSSTVYRARDRDSGRVLALKLLHSHFVTDQLIVDRFKREAETSKLLRHPNVVDVESWAVSESGQVYMTEEFVEGISLQDAIAESGWLSVDLTLAVAAQICSGLAAAHEMGVVHCDLKPGNIMLTRSPEGMLIVKVLDFGIAKIMPVTGDTVLRLTQSGNMQGSLLYMSPEQCLDEDLDGRSDVYSLACVLYESLTGKPPLCSRTAFETMNLHLTAMPAPLSTARTDLRWPDKLEGVLSRACAKKPKDRYQSMAEFQSALKKVIDLPTEIEWPERWTARSERIDADLKLGMNSKLVSSVEPKVIVAVVDPQVAAKSLATELRAALSIRDIALSFSFLAVTIMIMSFSPIRNPGIFPSTALLGLSLFFAVCACCAWVTFLSLLQIPLVRKASWFDNTSNLERMKTQSITVLQIVNGKRDFYFLKCRYDDFSGVVIDRQLVVRKASNGPVWRENSKELGGAKRVNGQSSPATSGDLPLPGYLFYDDKGEPVAISVLTDLGWVYPS